MGNKLKYCLYSKKEQSKEDLLLYADAFCLAKWLVKYEANLHGYESDFVPTDKLAGLHLKTSLSDSGMTLPMNFGSLNGVKAAVGKQGYESLQSDANLYLVFSDLLTDSEDTKLPETFREAITLIESLDVETDCPVASYYNKLWTHEAKQIWEASFSGRVY